MTRNIWWAIIVVAVILVMVFIYATRTKAAELCRELVSEGYWVNQTETKYADPTCPTGYHLHNEGNWNQRCHRDDKKTKPEHLAPTCPDGYSQDESTCSKEVDTSYYVDPVYKDVECEEPIDEPIDEPTDETPVELPKAEKIVGRPDLDFTQGASMGFGDGKVKLKWANFKGCSKVKIKIADDGVFGNGYRTIKTKDDGHEWIEAIGTFWAKIRCDEDDSRYSEVEKITP